jgi:nucleotide-binding universal stress UspA family protein
VEVRTETETHLEEKISSPDELEEQMTEHRRRRLQALTARLNADIDIQAKVLVGRPHEAVTREVIANERDLVLKSAESGKGLKERLFGGNDVDLIRACPCPVLLIRQMPAKPYRHRCVCAGVYQDEVPGSHRDDRKEINHLILEHATAIATSQFAELHVVHAWEAYGEQHVRSGRSPLRFDADNYVAIEKHRNRQALKSCLSELRESMDSEELVTPQPVCHLVKGHHRDEIIKAAEEIGADLVVVGDLAHSGLTRLIIESTAEAITRQLNCSVLVVEPPEFETPVVVDEQ